MPVKPADRNPKRQQ